MSGRHDSVRGVLRVRVVHRIAEMFKSGSFAALNTRGCKYSVVSSRAIKILRGEQDSTLCVQNIRM